MTKAFFAIKFLLIITITAAQAQQKGNIYPTELSNQPNDHFMIQFGGLSWLNKPDSIHTKGFSRSFNAYFMWNVPFKGNPRFGVAIGVGVGTDNLYFNETQPVINDNSTTLRFPDVSATNHFKKFKLVTGYLEAPIEFRYISNLKNVNKAFKIAIGAKVGLLVNAHTKGKTLENAAGQVLNDYTEKINSSRYFNTTRFSGTFRIGYSFLSLFTTYQLSSFFKEGAGADVRPLTVGLTLSGL